MSPSSRGRQDRGRRGTPVFTALAPRPRADSCWFTHRPGGRRCHVARTLPQPGVQWTGRRCEAGQNPALGSGDFSGKGKVPAVPGCLGGAARAALLPGCELGRAEHRRATWRCSHSPAHSLSHSLAHSFTCSLAHSLILSRIYLLAHSLAHSHSFLPQLTGCTAHRARQGGRVLCHQLPSPASHVNKLATGTRYPFVE